jgi:ribosomal protein S27E
MAMVPFSVRIAISRIGLSELDFASLKSEYISCRCYSCGNEEVKFQIEISSERGGKDEN